MVVGASFIGLEVAASLRAREVEVRGRPDERPLGRVLGPELGDFVRWLHEEHGVVFRLGQTAKAIGRARCQLERGERVAADFVVLGVGVRPRVALAEAAGLRVDNGIVVDEFLETSAPGVFAVGDIARWPEPAQRRSGAHRALGGGRAPGAGGGAQAPGRRSASTRVPFFWSQHYDVSINYVGHAPRYDQGVVDGSLEKHDASIRYLSGGKLLALASLFRDRVSLETELAMEESATSQ